MGQARDTCYNACTVLYCTRWWWWKLRKKSGGTSVSKYICHTNAGKTQKNDDKISSSSSSFYRYRMMMKAYFRITKIHKNSCQSHLGACLQCPDGPTCNLRIRSSMVPPMTKRTTVIGLYCRGTGRRTSRSSTKMIIRLT